MPSYRIEYYMLVYLEKYLMLANKRHLYDNDYDKRRTDHTHYYIGGAV